MLRTLVLLCLFISPLSGNVIYAQQASITVSVKADGVSLAAATISLLHAADSSWIRSEITDDKGVLVLKDVAPGKYMVMGSSVGYKTAGQAVEVKERGQHSCSIELQKEDKALNEVAVTAKKPFIEMSMGKVTVNIEGTTTTGSSNVLDLMRRLPGVTVDGNNIISMMSKAGVLVLVDDRQTYLSGDDLAEYLKAMSAEEVAQIELITQPGAKYDAAGNAGVINIKLKKNKRQGWNGNATLSYGEGVYFHRTESMLVSYKKNKLNLTLNVNDMEAIGFADYRSQLYYKDNSGNTIGESDTHSTDKERFSNTVVRLAADYDISDKTAIGINVRGTYHPNTFSGYAFVTNTDGTGSDATYNGINNANGFVGENVAANAYFSKKFSKQSTLDINFDYLSYSKTPYQDIVSTQYNSQMQALPLPVLENSATPSAINVYSLKADQSWSLKNGMKVEAGLKSSYVTSGDNAHYSLYQNSMWVPDTGKTNHFLYKENINAAYVAASKELGKLWQAKVGLRAEQTMAEGIQYTTSTTFNKSYASLFPTAYLTYKKDTNNLFELNYGRRIDRPSYRDLNPFTYYNYQNNYQVGNPELRPQFTNDVELKHSYKNRLITAVEFAYATDVVQGILLTNDTSRIVYSTSKNLVTNNYISLSEEYNQDIVKWWSLSASAYIFYATYAGQINGINEYVEWVSYWASINSRFDLGKGWKAELYASYVGPGRWSLTSSYRSNIGFEFGASKKVNDRWLVKFYANDPFSLYHLVSVDETNAYKLNNSSRFATQLFSLSLTYNLNGKQQKEHNSSTPDEAKRIR